VELGSSKTFFVSFTAVLSNVSGVSGSNSNPAGVMVAGTGVNVESGLSTNNCIINYL